MAGCINSGFTISVALTNPSIGEFTWITFPAWAMMPKNSSLPADSVYAQVVDLEQLVGVGATNVTLCTLTFRGDATGTTNLTITLIRSTMTSPAGTHPALRMRCLSWRVRRHRSQTSPRT